MSLESSFEEMDSGASDTLHVLTVQNCAACKAELNEPRILPCGEAVCWTCVPKRVIDSESFRLRDAKFNCPVCQGLHDDYPANKKAPNSNHIKSLARHFLDMRNQFSQRSMTLLSEKLANLAEEKEKFSQKIKEHVDGIVMSRLSSHRKHVTAMPRVYSSCLELTSSLEHSFIDHTVATQIALLNEVDLFLTDCRFVEHMFLGNKIEIEILSMVANNYLLRLRTSQPLEKLSKPSPHATRTLNAGAYRSSSSRPSTQLVQLVHVSTLCLEPRALALNHLFRNSDGRNYCFFSQSKSTSYLFYVKQIDQSASIHMVILNNFDARITFSRYQVIQVAGLKEWKVNKCMASGGFIFYIQTAKSIDCSVQGYSINEPDSTSILIKISNRFSYMTHSVLKHDVVKMGSNSEKLFCFMSNNQLACYDYNSLESEEWNIKLESRLTSDVVRQIRASKENLFVSYFDVVRQACNLAIFELKSGKMCQEIKEYDFDQFRLYGLHYIMLYERKAKKLYVLRQADREFYAQVVLSDYDSSLQMLTDNNSSYVYFHDTITQIVQVFSICGLRKFFA